MERLEGKIDKGWGYENIWVTNDLYCGKMLVFTEKGNKSSMHFHEEKDETWYVQSGEFEVNWIDTETAKINVDKLKVGDTWNNPPLLPHQLHCIEPGTILEVSTRDCPEDNYRVLAGDSQK